MRRRSLAGVVPLGLLAACTPTVDPDPDATQTVPEDLRRDPVLHGTLLDSVDSSSLRLPLEMTVQLLVQPAWSAAPEQLGGMLLGFEEGDGRLRFSALSEDGTLAWSAERPLGCTGFALTRDALDRDLAVLPDVASSDGAATTVTGYDLGSAAVIWGPMTVPGSRIAPGLVYAEPGERPMGTAGRRIALSPTSGEVALDEADLEGGRILAESLGRILTLQEGEVIASSADTSEELWRIPLPEGIGPDRARIEIAAGPAPTHAVLHGEEPDGGSLLDLADGAIVATGVGSAAVDNATGTIILITGTTVRGLTPDTGEEWGTKDPEALDLLCAGERLAFALRPKEGTLAVLDVFTGRLVQPYDTDKTGPLAVPEIFTTEGAAVVRVGETRYLATTQLDPDYGTKG